MYQDGDMVDNPDRVAIGAINPKTGQPYTMQEVASYTDTQGMLPTPFGKQYGGLDNTGKQLYNNYEQPLERTTSNNEIIFPNSPANPNYVQPPAFDPFNVPKWTDMNNPMDRIQKTLGNKLVPTLPQRVGTGNYGEFYLDHLYLATPLWLVVCLYVYFERNRHTLFVPDAMIHITHPDIWFFLHSLENLSDLLTFHLNQLYCIDQVFYHILVLNFPSV